VSGKVTTRKPVSLPESVNGLGSVALDSSSGNPFQRAFFFRGFEASPLQGTPQGLAVYVNGVGFNQPFGVPAMVESAP